MVSDDSGDIEAFYPGANYGDGREEEEEESPTSEGEAEGSSMGMDGDDSQDPGDPHFAGLRGGLWSRGVGESRRCYQPTSPQPASYRLDDDEASASDHDADRFSRPPRSGYSSPYGHPQGRRPGEPYYSESRQSESEEDYQWTRRDPRAGHLRTLLPPFDRGPGVQIRRTRVAHAHRRPLGTHKGTWATRTRAICGRTSIPTPMPGT